MLGRALGGLAVITVVILGGPGQSAAQPRAPQTLLFVPRGLNATEARDLSRALARELDMRVVHAARVGDRLAARAASAPGAAVAERVDAQERAAMDAYVHLRFGPAEQAFSQAIDATMEDPRRPADPKRLAQLLFGRALVGLATQRNDEAMVDLESAVTLDPDLAPDRDQYGPPVLRAVSAARRELARAPEVAIDVERSPEDATVWIDGREVPPGEVVRAQSGVRHLLTARRPGHEPRSQWIEASEGGRVPVVLPRISGATLALVALSAWESADPERSFAALDEVSAPLVARALGAERAVIATRAAAGITMRLYDDDGHVIRTAEGDAVDWEALPFTVLAALLAGRTLTPPSPADVALSVSAPSEVGLGEAIPIRVQLRDPERRVDAVAARCGAAVSTVRLDASERSAVALSVDAPERETALECLVRALDGEGRALGAPPDVLDVSVTESERAPFYAAWYFWLAVGLVAAGGVAAAIVATQVGHDPQQVLTIHGP